MIRPSPNFPLTQLPPHPPYPRYRIPSIRPPDPGHTKRWLRLGSSIKRCLSGWGGLKPTSEPRFRNTSRAKLSARRRSRRSAAGLALRQNESTPRTFSPAPIRSASSSAPHRSSYQPVLARATVHSGASQRWLFVGSSHETTKKFSRGTPRLSFIRCQHVRVTSRFPPVCAARFGRTRAQRKAERQQEEEARARMRLVEAEEGRRRAVSSRERWSDFRVFFRWELPSWRL